MVVDFKSPGWTVASDKNGFGSTASLVNCVGRDFMFHFVSIFVCIFFWFIWGDCQFWHWIGYEISCFWRHSVSFRKPCVLNVACIEDVRILCGGLNIRFVILGVSFFLFVYWSDDNTHSAQSVYEREREMRKDRIIEKRNKEKKNY